MKNSPGRKLTYKHLLLPALLLVMLALALLDLAIGTAAIPQADLWQLLLGNPASNPVWGTILWEIRLPRVLAALLVGFALPVGGLQMQTLFRNPLAGPGILGITSGASLGVALVMFTGGSQLLFLNNSPGVISSWGYVLAAMLGAGMVLLVILLIATRVKDPVTLLIVGIMVGNLTIALVSIWQYFSHPEQIKEFLFWTFGSLSGINLAQHKVLVPTVFLGLAMTFLLSKNMDVMLLGEEYAASMGVPIGRVRLLMIVSTSILAGSVTAFCGPIGFIGIAVPHLARSLFAVTSHSLLMPACCLLGGVLMLICDLISQWPGASVILPINAITTLLGSPVVIWVVVSRNHLKNSFS